MGATSEKKRAEALFLCCVRRLLLQLAAKLAARVVYRVNVDVDIARFDFRNQTVERLAIQRHDQVDAVDRLQMNPTDAIVHDERSK